MTPTAILNAIKTAGFRSANGLLWQTDSIGQWRARRFAADVNASVDTPKTSQATFYSCWIDVHSNPGHTAYGNFS